MKRLTIRDESGFYHLRRGPKGGEINKKTVVQHLGRLEDVALRPVSREQVERIRGEWMFPIFADQEDANDPRCQCSECGSIETPLARHRFCPSCGAPMTDEAVDIRLKELEALKDGKGD